MTKNQPNFSIGQERMPKNNDGPGDFIPPYPVWFCLGWFCPLPAAFWIGRIMKEKKPFLKYGILGKLIKDAHRVIFHPVYLIIVSLRQFESNYRIWFHSISAVKSALHHPWAWMRLWKMLIDGTKFCGGFFGIIIFLAMLYLLISQRWTVSWSDFIRFLILQQAMAAIEWQISWNGIIQSTKSHWNGLTSPSDSASSCKTINSGTLIPIVN